MTDRRTQAQLDLLAASLGVTVGDLPDLGRHGAEFVHGLRHAVSAALFDEHAPLFARVSRLAPLVPNALLAKLVPRLVPPLVAGRAAGALGLDHPDRIDDLLPRLPADYLAACAPYLDPRTIESLAPTVTPGILLPAARAILAAGEYATAAAFVEYATPELIVAFEQGIDDDRGVLAVASYVYSLDVLEQIVLGIPTQRLQRLVRGCLDDVDATATALSVLALLTGDARAEALARVAPVVDPTAEGRVRELMADPSSDDVVREVAEMLLDGATAARAAS